MVLTLAATDAAPLPSPVTPATGPSWIEHLGVGLDDTPMGKMGGRGLPPADRRREPMPSLAAEAPNAPFTLLGRDLYRLDCRSCHGPKGLGAPPVIHSLLDPVRATSAALVEKLQKERGRRLPPGMAEQLAADARKALLDRIANGGKQMPAFPHLQGDEVTALVVYLQALAGVPGAERRQVTVTEPSLRVGEHLVQGTCQICHPPTGTGPDPMTMYMRGVIPSLASLPEQRSPEAVVAKVREGRAAMMGGGMGMMGGGMGMMRHKGRMPVFPYLTEEEVVAAYLYLLEVPPR